ncbi:tetratricopeptide repeat protein [Planktomarina temperata]|uniref:UDP-N-acetylglucosamine--peptide N-acetylglucosaminyltransferase subunit n=1 Tax=Planktomarina temperata RCA23 TaxID=666509 RepID=A0AAN0RH18_9RHOB|nr:UDP-N-acetylglucosamine--peptide N-acetylglucosaminyltransferase subunit [Planktomarina temperata RCA23]
MAELTIDQALQQAIEAHKAGRVQEADRLYTAILKAQPKHPDANHNMGVLAVGVGKVQEALPFLKTALEANPATAQFWLSYIDALIKLDQLTDAKAVLDQAKSKGAKGDGFNKLEQRLQDAGQEPLLAKQIASEPQPKQPNILDSLKLDQAISLAKKKAKAGSTEEAKRVYQDILTKFPKNKRASDGMKRSAGKTVGEASKVQDPPQDQLQSLVNLYSQGQLQLALKQAETLVQQFPQSAILFNIQGAVLQGLRQLDASIEAYNKALAIKPDNADAYYNMGNALQEQGKLEEAIEAYNKALSLKPDYAEAYNNMGNALKEQGKLEEAIEAHNKALAIKPDNADAYYNMGNALKEQGKLEEAIEAYNKALSLKPDYAEAYNNMGNALREQGKLEKAIEAYNKALAIKPDYAEAYNNMGNALKDQDKLDEAIEAYNKALVIKPDYAEAAQNLVKLPIGNIDEKTILRLNKKISILSSNIQDQSKRLFFEANLFTHNGEYDEAFKRFVEANNIKANEIASALENLSQKYYQNVKRIQNWSPHSLKWTEPSLKKLFLLGPSRSGKSSLENLLMRIPQIYPMYENINLNTLQESDLGSSKVKSLNMTEMFYHDEKCLLNDGHRFVTSTLPESIFHIDQLLDGFVNSFCVLVKRDQTDVASEIFTREYRKGNFFFYTHLSIQEYLNTYSVIWEEIKRKTPQRTLEIEYEDILLKPHEVLDQISQFTRENLILDNAEQYSTKKRISPFREHYAQKFKSAIYQ